MGGDGGSTTGVLGANRILLHVQQVIHPVDGSLHAGQAGDPGKHLGDGGDEHREQSAGGDERHPGRTLSRGNRGGTGTRGMSGPNTVNAMVVAPPMPDHTAFFVVALRKRSLATDHLSKKESMLLVIRMGVIVTIISSCWLGKGAPRQTPPHYRIG